MVRTTIKAIAPPPSPLVTQTLRGILPVSAFRGPDLLVEGQIRPPSDGSVKVMMFHAVDALCDEFITERWSRFLQCALSEFV